MLRFTLKLQRPPKARSIKKGVVMRFDHVYEIDPASMQIFNQQNMPAWDTERIVKNRWEHLAWMHDHFADGQISGEELVNELQREKKKPTAKRQTQKRKNK